jgi:hypothetical protein
MLKRFQFSISDMLWATAGFAVLLCVSTFVIRNPWVKLLGVGLLVAIVVSLPTVFGLLLQRGDSKYSEPFISWKTFFVVAVLAGLSLPFLVVWFMRVLMQTVRGQ